MSTPTGHAELIFTGGPVYTVDPSGRRMVPAADPAREINTLIVGRAITGLAAFV